MWLIMLTQTHFRCVFGYWVPQMNAVHDGHVTVQDVSFSLQLMLGTGVVHSPACSDGEGG